MKDIHNSLAAERYREMCDPPKVHVKDRSRTALILGRVNYLKCHVCGAVEVVKEPEKAYTYGWQYLELIWGQVSKFKKQHRNCNQEKLI